MKSLKRNGSRFHERFKGRITLIDKEGLSFQSLLPIEKPRLKCNTDCARSQKQLKKLKLSFDECTPGRELEDMWKRRRLPRLAMLKKCFDSVSSLQRNAGFGFSSDGGKLQVHRDMGLNGGGLLSGVNKSSKELLAHFPTIPKRDQYNSAASKHFLRPDRHRLLLQKLVKRNREVAAARRSLKGELTAGAESRDYK